MRSSQSGTTEQDDMPDQPTHLTGQQIETITITRSGDSVSVDRDSVTVRQGQTPVIRWQSDPAGQNWIVAFGTADTPFQNGKRVFFGGTQSQNDRQGQILGQADTATYKYWVFYADSAGNYVELDPKLVIIEDTGVAGDVGN